MFVPESGKQSRFLGFDRPVVERNLPSFRQVSQAELQLRFDGPAMQAHEMDVMLLGPSLAAFGELCSEANLVFNGPNSKIQVFVKADIRPNCVTIDFHLVQTVWQTVSDLMGNERITEAKEILQWIGILTGGGATLTENVSGLLSLVQFLTWKKDKKETRAEIRQTHNGNVVNVNIEGNNNTVIISEPVYKLSRKPKVVESVKMLSAPVSSATGIQEAVFIEGNREQLKIDEQMASALAQAKADSTEAAPQTFTAHIVVHTVTLDRRSKHWRFKLNNRVENIDISETRIAEEALARGGVNVGDTYKVKIEMIENEVMPGEYKTDYKIKEVLEFSPGIRRTQAPLI